LSSADSVPDGLASAESANGGAAIDTVEPDFGEFQCGTSANDAYLPLRAAESAK
jgi:hypothetical protein